MADAQNNSTPQSDEVDGGEATSNGFSSLNHGASHFRKLPLWWRVRYLVRGLIADLATFWVSRSMQEQLLVAWNREGSYDSALERRAERLRRK